MDWTNLPPLASLRAFEAAARNLNYSAAGRELNVSHAAVAQQVRALEAFLGMGLAERSGRGIALTPPGSFLAEQLTRGFEQVADAVRQLTEAEAQRPVHITMTPAFAVNWFMPRMPLFREAHPDIDLMVNPTPNLVDLTAMGCDVAIRFGTGDWPGLESEPLIPSDFVIVAAPSLLPSDWSGRIEDLLHLPWLQEMGTTEVAQWLEELGIALPTGTHITSLPGYMQLGAVRDGQGIAPTARTFVEDDIAAGRLVIVHEENDDPRAGYYLAWRPGVQRPALKAFLKWIRDAAKVQPSPAQSITTS